MLKWEPEESVELWCWCEEREESTLAKGWRSRLSVLAGGGVRARLRGEAWKDWNWEPSANGGGTEVRDATWGDW